MTVDIIRNTKDNATICLKYVLIANYYNIETRYGHEIKTNNRAVMNDVTKPFTNILTNTTHEHKC